LPIICSGLNAFLTIYTPSFNYRQSNTRTGIVLGGQVIGLILDQGKGQPQ
jgi:hypothetical protein